MRRLLPGVICFWVFLCVPIRAEDWPRWRGPRGDGISRETGIPEKLPAGGLKEVWSAVVGIGYSSPVAVDGKVFMFSFMNNSDTLQAFDAETGRVLWTSSYGSGWKGDYPGTRCTPLIEADRVYTYGGAGDLACWELASGKLVWHVNVLAKTGSQPLTWGQASNPAIDDQRIYVQGGKGGPVCVAVRKIDGGLIWQSEKGLGGYAHPILVDVQGSRQLIVFGGDRLYAMDPETGKTIWSYPWKTSWDVNAATPVYRDGRLFITSDYGRGCAMFSLRPDGFEKLWENKAIQSRFQGAILDGQCLYSNSEGQITCVNWEDGSVRWQSREFRIEMGGAIVRAGQMLVMQSQRGPLGLARATPEGFRLIGQAPLVEGREVWSTPLIYRGKLYAKGATDFRCVEFSEK